MADRKAELERKKKRLEEIRIRKEQEKNKSKGAATAKSASSPLSSRASSNASSSGPSIADVDALIAGIDLPAPSASSARKTAENQSVSSSSQQSDSLPTSPQVAKKEIKLSVATQPQQNIAPKEHVQYSKETQTLEEYQPKIDDSEKTSELTNELEKSLHIEEEKKAENEREEPQSVRVELSDERKAQILSSQDFSQFLEHTSRIVEKALSVPDFAYDYGAHEDQEIDSQLSKKLTLNRQFYDEKWSKHRCITCLDWSTQNPELLLASYNQNEHSPQDPEGIALVWNMKFPKSTPEYIFHNQSPIMSACFSQYHPNLIVGGTYSGQIVLWDNRSRKRTPVQKTPLSAAAHTHPVYSVQVIGTQNAHNLISYSTDGKMCQWSLDMLAQPQEVTELQQNPASKSVSVTCASFLPGDVNHFVVGSEDGGIYSALRHGTKAGIQQQFQGHSGPVTSINYNAVPGPIDFSHLFLTTSFDWTIKLWSNKEQKPIHTFEDNSDYVYDSHWSPVHPALFAAVDGGMGRLDLWNLNNDTEVATTSITIDSMAAINRVRWAGSGLQLAAGDDDGHIYIYDVGEQLALPRADEWSRFVTTIQDLQSNSAGFSSSHSPEKSGPLSPSGGISSIISPQRIGNTSI